MSDSRADRASPDVSELPTHQELRRASVGAVLVAGVLLITTVLPAEEGFDPTGIGSVLGLTALGELKNAPPPEVAEPTPDTFTFRKDELAFTLRPKEGTEIKAVMREGDQLVYSWRADQGDLFFDFHGEPRGAAADVFTSYEKGTTGTARGTFEAPFEGVHGWYWKNHSGYPVTVTLSTTGVYAHISQK